MTGEIDLKLDFESGIFVNLGGRPAMTTQETLRDTLWTG